LRSTAAGYGAEARDKAGKHQQQLLFKLIIILSSQGAQETETKKKDCAQPFA
jgi:hypothetical protein